MSRVVVIGGIPDSLIHLRGPLIGALVRAGHRVTAMAGSRGEPWVEEELAELGAVFATYPLDRTGKGPLADVATLQGLVKRFRELEPDVVIAYTAKPVIWGALAARRARVPTFHAMITGLGDQFTSSGKGRLSGWLIPALYRRALLSVDTVIFQNTDDRDFFLARRLVRKEQAACVAGSGIDLQLWQKTPLPSGPPRFLMIARMVASKGMREYAEAARRVRLDHPEVKFVLAGPLEKGIRGVPLAELEAWHESGAIEYLGNLQKVRETMLKTHVYVLPSYYGEGLPRTILEAMATGRPVLSTHNVGCRDAVEDGVTGRLIPPRDTDALEAELRWFLAHRDRWEAMGNAGRQRVETRFDAHKVCLDLLDITGLAAA